MNTNFSSTRVSKIALGFVALLIAPAIVAAQTSVTVNATVAASVTATASNTTIAIGSVAPGGTGSIAAASGAQVSVSFNTSTITYSMPDNVTLTRTSTGSTGETLSASITCALKQGSTAAAACGAAVSGVYSVNAAYAASGGVHGTSLATAIIYAGASVSPTATARAGVYSGTFSITVSNSAT